jgi:hypothetical protein
MCVNSCMYEYYFHGTLCDVSCSCSVTILYCSDFFHILLDRTYETDGWTDPSSNFIDLSIPSSKSDSDLDTSAITMTQLEYILLLLFQLALKPLWVLAYSTVTEYSQQEGFYRVPLPAAHQTPNLEDQWLEHSNSRHRRALAVEGGTMGEKWLRILPKVMTSTSLLGSFTCHKLE